MEKVAQLLGAKIAEIREAKGLTVEKLATKIGVTAEYLAELETGARLATLEELFVLQLALGCKVSDFFAGVDAAGGLQEA